MAEGKKRRGLSGRSRILMIMGLIVAVIFMPTAILLTVGMLPSMVALIIAPRRQKAKAITVGAMNLAGCVPFILQLWTSDNTAVHSFMIITDPRTIIVMYCAAGVGYAIDWAVSGLVSTIMVQSGSVRIQQISKRQAELVARWGREVTGEIPTDRQGFPTETSSSQ
jgi:hypothetical protein